MQLILDKVSYSYDRGQTFEKKAISDISLTIPKGQFIGLIGHTGSGKSTLIQLLNGLLKATEGNIYYNGENIYDKDYSMRKLRSRVGLVFQYPEHQLFEASVIKDVQFGPKNLGLPKLEVDLRSYEALKLTGIGEEYLDASPFELSGGQKRRVAIAGVLAMKPEVLILDEPTAGLDPRGAAEILENVAEIQSRQGITVILVSHSMEQVAEYVERLIVLSQGTVLMDSTPTKVFRRYRELEAAGLAAPQIFYCMQELKALGLPVSGDELTVGLAKDSIMRWWRESDRK